LRSVVLSAPASSGGSACAMYCPSSGIAVHRLSPFATTRVVYCDSRISLAEWSGRRARKRMLCPDSLRSVFVVTVVEATPSSR
jgi:hypothetical protein